MYAVTSKVGKVKMQIGAAKTVALSPSMPTMITDRQMVEMRRKYKGRLKDLISIAREDKQEERNEAPVRVEREDPTPEEPKDVEIDEDAVEMYDMLNAQQIVSGIRASGTKAELDLFSEKEAMRAKMRGTRMRTTITKAIKKRMGEI